MAIHPNKAKNRAYYTYTSNYTASMQQQFPLDEQSPSTKFKTHKTIHAQRLHSISEFIMLPARYFARSVAKLFQPNPGRQKSFLRNLAVRSGAAISSLVLLPFAIPSLLFSLGLRMIDHYFRPAFSTLYTKPINQPELPKLTKENPLRVRTHNLGFVTSTMSIMGDLREPKQRAKELSKQIVNDTLAPDVIVFQEGFHEDATRILCHGIKSKYPYIIHSVAPQISGFNSGCMVASKYPILKADFERFQHMHGPERASPRGIIRIKLNTEKGDLYIYGIHTQALVGNQRAQARLKQLQRVQQIMDEDHKKYPEAHQVLVGDFNSSRITAWGGDNLSPPGQAEEPVLQFMAQAFTDPYVNDHDPVVGVRTAGKPFYLDADWQAFSAPNLKEPSASWHHGPFANPGRILSAHMAKDRRKHHHPKPDVKVTPEKSTWGTNKWQQTQTANTARFDYVLFPKKSDLDANVEIRHIGGNKRSACTDHLPVDARIWVK